MPSEQYVIEESTQSAGDSNDKPGKSPSDGGSSPMSSSDCAEILMVDEAEAIDPKWPDEHANTLEVPDERSQRTDDNTEVSTEASKLKGDTSRWAGGYSIEDASQTQIAQATAPRPNLPMVEVGTGDSKLLDECTNTSEAPGKGSQCIQDNVEVTRSYKPNSMDLDMSNGRTNKPSASEHDCKATMPMTSSTNPKITFTTGVTLPMSDPPRLRNESLEHSIAEPSLHVAKTTWPRPEHPDREPDRSSQLRETERPQPDRDRAPEGCHSRPTCENPPVRIQEMGVHGRAEASEGDSANIDSTTIKVEIRSGSVETTGAPPYSPHLERHTKEPDREQASSSHGDADSREFVDSHGVRKAMLAMPPKPPPNSVHSIPRMVKGTHHHGGLEPYAKSVSFTHTRRNAYCAHVALMQPPQLLSASMK